MAVIFQTKWIFSVEWKCMNFDSNFIEDRSLMTAWMCCLTKIIPIWKQSVRIELSAKNQRQKCHDYVYLVEDNCGV